MSSKTELHVYGKQDKGCENMSNCLTVDSIPFNVHIQSSLLSLAFELTNTTWFDVCDLIFQCKHLIKLFCGKVSLLKMRPIYMKYITCRA